MDTYNIYKDIDARTDGEIYIGVVGPVRSGKSTFIRKVAEKLILPNMEKEAAKERAKDEMPQTASGKTVMTIEPKFIPKDACIITPVENVSLKIRLIDCVGFMIDGANGVYENDHERLVKTPWYDYEIPFSEAAEFGTKKVINDHSTVGIVMTTDGSFSQIQAEAYLPAEEKAINELIAIGKPFITIVNSSNPNGEKAQKCVARIKEMYDTEVIALDCENMSVNDINRVFETILNSFPIKGIEFYFDKYIETLSDNNEIKQNIISSAKEILGKITYIRDFTKGKINTDSQYIESVDADKIDLSSGILKIKFNTDEKLYYDMLSEISDEKISNEYDLLNLIKQYSKDKKYLERYKNSIDIVKNRGYSVVSPMRDEIEISEPEVIKNAGRYGVKIKANSPSYHMIKVNINTEIAPIVGSEQQANDLKAYIEENSKTGDTWDINIFGKTIEQLVDDGINTKLAMMNDDCQTKLMDTMQKVVNDNNGGLICLII